MMFHILYIVHKISIAIKQSFLYTKHMRNRSDEMIHFEYGQWRPVQSVAVRGRIFYTLCNRFEGGTMGLPPELASVFSLGDVTSTN